MTTKTIFNRVLSLFVATALLCGTLFVSPAAPGVRAAGLPTVSYQGLTLDDRTTTDEDLPLLVQNPDGRDFVFFPDEEAMTQGDTFFEYDYGSTVEFTGVEMVGWWPSQQAVNKVSFQYYDGEWKDSDQEVVPQWTTSESGPETLKIDLSSPVSGTKFRIKILGTNTVWSSKCCMHLLAPVTSDTARLKLESALENANKVKENAVVGTQAGQYPQEAYDTFVKAIDKAQALLDGGAAAEEYEQMAEELSAAQDTFEASVIIAGKLTEPEVTLVNLTAQGGSPQLLVNNPGHGDFDFGPGGSDMSSQNAYIEYNYVDVVQINEVDLIGWWPKDQAVKNISFEYYENGEWVAADQNIEVPWQAPANTGVEEALTIELADPVTTTKFRIKINATYHSWSSKINMRLMEPKGEVIRSIKPLYDAVRAAQDYVDSVLIGDKPGEFPQSAVDALQIVVSEAIAKLEDPNLTEDELMAQIERVEEAKEIFIQSQNPVSGIPVVSSEGLTLQGGSLDCLVDGQIATETIFAESGELAGAFLEFDYGADYRLNELSILASNPMQSAPTVVAVQYWDGSEWKTAADAVDLKWKGTIPNVEGRNIVLSAPVAASKFRIQILETNTGSDECRINEILLKGRLAVDLSGLNAVVEQAEAILAEEYSGIDDLLNILRISLATAKDEELLARSTQDMVDAMQADLQAAVDAINDYDTDQARCALIEKLDEASSITGDGYTAESYAALQDAIAAAQAVLDNPGATVDELTAQLTALQNAIDALAPIPGTVDRRALKTAIDEATGYDLDRYIDDGKEAFANALNEAVAVYENAEATQEQIDAAKEALITAMGNLRLRADKSSLEQWLNKLGQYDLSKYTEESVAAVLALKAEAEALLSQDLDKSYQSQIQETAQKLGAALNALKLKDDAGSTGDPVTTGDAAPAAAFTVLFMSLAALLAMKKKNDR